MPLAERFTAGVAGVIEAHGLPWHVQRLGCRAEYWFCPPPPDGAAAAAAVDEELEGFLHLWCLNRGVLLTPFHNMALFCPAHTEADVDRHTEVFGEALTPHWHALHDRRHATSRVPPARPHHKLTEDGRRMREVLSYSRRGNRFTPNQAAAWAAHHEKWVIPDAAVDEPGFSLARWFGREAPLIVEIGSGDRRGDRGAGGHPAGVRRAGPRGLAAGGRRHAVAARRGRCRERAADRRRRGLVARAPRRPRLGWPSCGRSSRTPGPRPGTTSDGWSTRRSPGSRPAGWRPAPPGGWRPTGRTTPAQMREVLDAEPGLEGGPVPRWEERPVTRFERKGIEAGRTITDLAYRRV